MKLLSVILFCLCCTGIAKADTITLNPCDQNGINQALQQGNVYLNPGIYEVTGSINVPRDRILSGDPNAIIKVPDHSSWWYDPTVGIIQVKDPYNIEISGFQLDGNCENLDPNLASSPGHAHDCEHLVQVIGSSTSFGNNIKINDLTLYDSFSDGLKIYFIDNAQICKNKIRNTQHECVFSTCLTNSIVQYNELQGITSDCLRFDNCVNCDIGYNTAWSYNGSHASNTFMHGENGVQIGNADSSKGYDATNKPTSTKNIHFHDNTLIDNGLQAILLDSTALSASANVVIKNNTIIGHYALEKSGIPFDIDNYSYENPPTKEMSEKVFRSIFDILGMKFTSPIYTRTNSRLVGNIIEYNNTVNPHSLVSVNYTGLDKVSYEYDGNSSIWSNGTWQGTIPHQGNALYLPGPVDQSKLKVTCYTKSEYFEVTNFSITKEEWSPSDSFKPWVYAFVFILLIFSLYIRHILKYYF